MLSQGVTMAVPYQEDLRKWVQGPGGAGHIKESGEDRRKWTMMQAAQLSQERECTIVELEALCKKRGILIWSIKYYTPDFFEAVIKKTKTCAVQEIIEEVKTDWYSLHQLKALIKQKNEKYHLGTYHGEISINDIQDYDPDWFDTVFKERYITLPEIIKKGTPKYRRVLDR